MNIYEHIDYTLLKATMTSIDVWNLCEKAEEKGCASVCIPSQFVSFAHGLFPKVPVCTVVGFPLGNSTIETKVAETRQAISNGASEIDMVINVGMLKNGNIDHIKKEIEMVSNECTTLKVIIETCYLTEEEIALATKIVDESSADYVKTSTGFGTRGASFEDVEIIKRNITHGTKIKASGGIRTKENMEKFIQMGCDRIGASTLPE